MINNYTQHIKEKKEDERYNIGDYVLLKFLSVEQWKNRHGHNLFKRYGKLISIDHTCATLVISNNKEKPFYIDSSDYERKLNADEIEEFEEELKTLKYNL